MRGLWPHSTDYAQGVHYTEKMRPRPPLQQRLPLSISTAFHDLQQLQTDYGALDYAFLSPIFDSISKEGYAAAFDHKSLMQSIASSSVPLIALGGKLLCDGQHTASLLSFSCAYFSQSFAVYKHIVHAA